MTSEAMDHIYKDMEIMWRMCRKVTSLNGMSKWRKFSLKVKFSKKNSVIQWPLRSKIIFNKLKTILWNICGKKFKIIWFIWLWCIRFQSYKFNSHVLIAKKFSSKCQIFNNVFRPFIDLWGKRSFIQTCRQSYEIYVEMKSKQYDRWFMIYKIPKLQVQFTCLDS